MMTKTTALPLWALKVLTHLFSLKERVLRINSSSSISQLQFLEQLKKKWGVFSSSAINHFLWYCGTIDSEGEDPDNAKNASLFWGMSRFHKERHQIRMTMNSMKDPINVAESNSASKRGRTFAFQFFLLLGVYDSMTE